MTDLINLFSKIAEHYGQWAAIIIVAVVAIVYGVYFILKNYSTTIKSYLEGRIHEAEQAHVDAALHRKNVTPKIRAELLSLATEIKADRVIVFEFSNGSSNLVGLPFLYTSATCEVITPGTQPVSAQYQKINTSIIGEFLEALESKGYTYIPHIDCIRNKYPVLHSMMTPNGVHSALFYVLYGVNDTIGFIVATTVREHSFTRDESLPKMASSAQRISSLLNFNALHIEL